MQTRFRSVLFLPADNGRAVEKARGLTCDLAVLDLEDAVAPDRKVQARTAAVQALTTYPFAVRINGLDTPWGADDLKALAGTDVGVVVAPKVEDAAGVAALSQHLPDGARLWAMIETPRALMQLGAIAGSGGALAGLMLGINDLAKALGTGPSADREPLKPWMAAMVTAARAHGLIAIDGVFNRFQDAEGFAAEAAQARLFGFDGKSLIHPSQIDPCHAAFAPSEAEIAFARAVVAAFDAPEAAGKGAIRVQGEMVERLHLEQAKALLATL
ncbi:MAG TPA: CoA ester lyase [Brevundimonas sp.]|uniref:HpcH/HpaI aldolase/citrate lyase family protein n=1 Tax=Brevundimonas sp. TaxID=1871086 RepID=UPI00261B2506|nr:CoA ester lyase [Brevundimonas sp.]HRO31913.1 CoA ester lyase [Brevundimonas sp.]